MKNAVAKKRMLAEARGISNALPVSKGLPLSTLFQREPAFQDRDRSSQQSFAESKTPMTAWETIVKSSPCCPS